MRKRCDPETTMTLRDALDLARTCAGELMPMSEDAPNVLPHFVLLLRWMAFKATPCERDELFNVVELESLSCFEGVFDLAAERQREALSDERRGRGRR